MSNASIQLSFAMQGIAQRLEKEIENAAGERVAFTLLVFTGGRASYVSTAPREISVREIRKLLDYWDQGMPDVPAHDYKG